MGYYTPEQIRRFKKLGAFDAGTSYLPLTGHERTQRKGEWGRANGDDDEA